MKNTKHIREFIKANKNVSGVYAIICTKTWRSYVGSSANIGVRIRSHMSALKNNRHVNNLLQLDFNNYTENHFYCELLEICDHKKLILLENKFKNLGYNLYNIQKDFRLINLSKVQKSKFESFINKDNYNNCWIWTGRKDKDGYGRYSLYKANRVAYFLSNPLDGQENIIRHTCNNKSCVNPDHLLTGSFHDNSIDISYNSCDNFKLNFVLASLIRNIALAQRNFYNGKQILDIIREYYIDISSTTFYDIMYNRIYYDSNWNFECFSKTNGKKINKSIVNWIRSSYKNSYKKVYLLCKKHNIDISYDQVINIITNKQHIDHKYIFNKTDYNKPWTLKDDEFLRNNCNE